MNTILDYILVSGISIIGVINFIEFKKGEKITWIQYWLMFTLACLQIIRNILICY